MTNRKVGDTPHHYRSGEAARLARMPAATLRIWERRYGVVAPPKTPSGQRMYSDGDVQRIRLLKTLVGQGHSISSIASLRQEELEALSLASSHSQTLSDSLPSVFMIGKLQVSDSAVARVGMQVVGRAESIEHTDQLPDLKVDALIINTTSLHEDAVSKIAARSQAWGAQEVAIVYGFGTARAIELARLAGFELSRFVESHTSIVQIVSRIALALSATRYVKPMGRGLWLRTRRRFDEAMLASLSSLSSTIKCECPRHLFELISQLSVFERYSDECVSRSAADAFLHRHLGDTANRAAEMLESALAEILRAEGVDDDVLLQSGELPGKQLHSRKT
ncbi:MerR family transcriptional regulator [Burkholderia cepacia]|uniref:MerR family transcriptional regulator n=1 Tax=Burkholderia cepacia TaxID=292 RepID=UPI0009BB4F94|nr:MerR family transcriptional regulator [Burkholderia cepacia]